MRDRLNVGDIPANQLTDFEAHGTFVTPAQRVHTHMQDIVYLACPYTHADPLIRIWRYELATAAAATLIARGLIVFSPITMTHPIDILLAGADKTLGSDYWLRFDEAFMKCCSQMIILTLEGWDQSDGISREIEFFRRHGKRVSFMDKSDISPSCARLEANITQAKID